MTTAFDRFVGKEVKVLKTQVLNPYTQLTVTHYDLDSGDPVIAEIRALHPEVRVWLPTMLGTSDFHADRLNLKVTECVNGKFVISAVNFG